MKKKHLHAFRHILAGSAILAMTVSAQAQVSNSETWSSFVESNANPSVKDTFRCQLFNQAERNNWKYILKGDAAVSEDHKWLKLPLSSSVVFEEYTLSHYEDVYMVLGFTVFSLVPNETLFAIFSNKNGVKRKSSLHTASSNENNVHYSVAIKGNPYYLELSASDPVNGSKNGYFQIDSVYSYGTIRQYSLFSGKGNWNDTLRWSHLPPLRYRSALIHGNAEIDSTIQCKQAFVADGSLNITEKGHFIVDTLVLYNRGNALTTADNTLTSTDNLLTITGELTVNKQLSIHYTFPEKGKWYFLSFPFDVPLKGIDKRFQLKDDTFKGEGNYLYVQVYDGDKRALTKRDTGNWTVFPLPASADAPVFERGKGYLVALDAAATDNTLTLSVESSRIPDDFGKTSSIPVHTSLANHADKAHSGWYLCGNPLPSSLPLSRMASNPALDGYIYYYEGNDYKSCPIGSNYALPPFSAFFVKASEETEINLTENASPEKVLFLKSGYAYSASGMEPKQSVTHNLSLSDEPAECNVKGKTVYLTHIPVSGTMYITDFSGRMVYHHLIPSGSSSFSLPLPAGFYIINIVADRYRTQYKCVLTQ